MHTCVVRNSDYHTCVYSRVSYREYGIGGYVKSDVLHRTEASFTCKTGAESRLNGNLFVRRPLGVNLLVFCGKFRYLRARSSGIAGNKGTAGFVKSSGNGFVAEHQLLHFLNYLPDFIP